MLFYKILTYSTPCVWALFTQFDFEDVDSLINGDETRSVGGSYDLSVTKDLSMGSLEGDIFAFANNDFQISSATGVVSFKSGGKLDMRSAKAMTIKTEAGGLNITSAGAVTETFGGSLTP